MARYEEIKIGDKAAIEHAVTARDIEKFVELTGDDNRLHTDPEYAARTSYKKPVVHGMIGASFISTVIGTKLPGDGALWFAQSLEFLLPVRVGDKLTVRAEVTKKIDHLQAIELKTDILNQTGQVVTTGFAKVKIIQPSAEAAAEPRPPKKVALVVGGTGGIGSAVCRALARDGFDVAVHCFRKSEAAAALVDEIRALGRKSVAVQGDARVKDEVENAVNTVIRHLGAVSVLVNCATADTGSVGIAGLAWEDMQRHMEASVHTAFNLVQAVLPAMETQQYGKIILIGSHYLEAPSPKLLPYITAKGAVAGFGRALALELAPKGIRVNLVSPSMTETDLISNVPEKEKLLASARTPLRRLATPEDVAGAVAFLASDRSDFLAGETIRVNGGQSMI